MTGNYMNLFMFMGNELKNLGRLWLAYTELQGDFYMLQLISVDSWHFTHTMGHYHASLHTVKEPDTYKDQVRMWAFYNTPHSRKESWAFVS